MFTFWIICGIILHTVSMADIATDKYSRELWPWFLIGIPLYLVAAFLGPLYILVWVLNGSYPFSNR
jgi:hypothetical protein